MSVEDTPSTAIELRVTRLEAWFHALSAHVTQLETDVGEIREALAHTATKEDVAAIGVKIERSINGILRDALNAVPARQASIWAAVTAIATIGIVFITIVRANM